MGGIRLVLATWYRLVVMSPRSRSYPPETIALAIVETMRGKSQREVSRSLSIPRETVREWLTDYRTGRISRTGMEHIHQWIISSPDGGDPLGLCMLCFETSGDFRNSLPERGWG